MQRGASTAAPIKSDHVARLASLRRAPHIPVRSQAAIIAEEMGGQSSCAGHHEVLPASTGRSVVYKQIRGAPGLSG